jgi:hypothetical protein
MAKDAGFLDLMDNLLAHMGVGVEAGWEHIGGT